MHANSPLATVVVSMRPPCVGLVSLTSHHLPCRGWGLCSPQRGSRCRAPRWSRPNYRVPSMLALPSKQPPMHGQIYAWKPISVRNTTDVVPPPSWTPSRSPNRPASCRHHLMARCGGLDPAATWRPASHHRSGFFHYAWRPTTTTPHRLCHRHHPGLPRSRLCLRHHWGSQRNRVGSRSSLLVGCPTREGEDPAATILATTRFPMARSGGREGGGGKEAGGVVAA